MLLCDGVENPANRTGIATAAQLLGGSCVETSEGRLIAVENAAGARAIYGRRPLRATTTLAVGHERRGVSRATLAAAAETLVIPTAVAQRADAERRGSGRRGGLVRPARVG